MPSTITDPLSPETSAENYDRRSAAGLANVPPAVEAVTARLNPAFVRALGVELNGLYCANDRAAARHRADICRSFIRGYALGCRLDYEDGTALMDYVTALEMDRPSRSAP
jgi:hypothetical protein